MLAPLTEISRRVSSSPPSKHPAARRCARRGSSPTSSRKATGYGAIMDPVEAFNVARRAAAADDIIVVTGSTVVVGAVRDWWMKKHAREYAVAP